MKPIFLAIGVLVSGLSCSHIHPAMTGLKDYQWNSRPLLIFGTGPEVEAQRKELNSSPAPLLERDVVVMWVGDTSPPGMPSPSQLRTKLGLEGDFHVVLIGKDGGVKMRRRDVTSVTEISVLIDSMPMRKEEMTQRTPSSQPDEPKNQNPPRK